MRELRLRFFCLGFSLLLIGVTGLQSQTVVIFDQERAPLNGVEVFNKTVDFLEISDIHGEVSIGAVPEQDTLFFRFLGFEEVSYSKTELREQGYKVFMEPSSQLINELVILGRSEQLASELPYQILTLDQKTIASTHSQNTADVLGEHAGVFVQKSQMGGGSPVIRGFEANRVLLVVDGVRLNNAIYRSGHLQNAITVDASILDKMDVIFGPNSLMYGSDALGGVVHFRTRDPSFSIGSDKHQLGNVFSRWSSANNEKTVHFDYEMGFKKVSFLTSLSYSDFGDLRMGKSGREGIGDFGLRLKYQGVDQNNEDVEVINRDPLVQIGTGYRQFDMLQKVFFKINDLSGLKVNMQYSTSSDVPRYDNLSELRDGRLRWAEWYYGPQKRFMTSITYNNVRSSRFYDNAIVIAAFQRIDEDRHTRLFSQENLDSQLEDVNVLSFTTDFNKSIHRNHSLNYGIDFQYNWIDSRALSTNVQNFSVSNNVLSRYASESNYLRSTGAYLFYKGQSKNEIFNLISGIRYSNTTYRISYNRDDVIEWPEIFYDGIESDNNAFTWSIGGTLNHPSGWQVRAMLSTAFRSPNIDDLAKIRINNNEITFPNPSLKPEQSLNYEVTIGKSISREFNISATGFYTSLENAIIRGPFLAPDGSSNYEANGELLQVVANQNLQEAYIIGFSGNVRWTPYAGLTLKSSVNVIKGREKRVGLTNLPLAHIPPIYGSASIDYKRKNYSFLVDLNYNALKPLSEFGGSVDNPDLASPEGALAWKTLNVYVKKEFEGLLTISIGVQNVLDQFYRPFSSGVSGPGRNWILELRKHF